MILDRLVLHNFKRFRDEDIRFRDGITGILGNNGTGKSSLVQAIFFALYGVQATGIAADYIVSAFAGPKEKCEVRLDFRIGGDSFTVLRTFKKGKTVSHDASFHQNGKLMATGVSPVEEAVKRTLGMGPVDFKNTIYAGQKDLLTLLENTPGKRKEWFQKALGIDYLKNGSDALLREQVDAKNAELQRKEGELAALAGRQNEAELVRLEAMAEGFRAAIKEHEKQKLVLAQQREAVDAKLKVLADKKLAYNRLLQQKQAAQQELEDETIRIGKLDAALAMVAEEEAEYQKIEKTAGTYGEVRARLDALVLKKAEHARIAAELGFADREIRDFDARTEMTRAHLAALEKDAREKDRICGTIRDRLRAGPELADNQLDGAVRYRLNDIMKQAMTIAARIQQYQAERDKIKADQEKIKSAGPDGTCPLCRQKLGAHFGDLDKEFSARLEELEEKAVADLEKQEKLSADRAALEALVSSLDTLRTIAERLKMREGYDRELADLLARRTKKEEERKVHAEALARLAYDESQYRSAELEVQGVQKVQARFIELGKKIGQAVTMKQQRADLVARTESRREDLVRMDKEIAASPYDPAETTNAEAELAVADRRLRDEEVAVATATRDRKFAEEKITEFRRAQEEIAVLQKQAQALRDEIANLKLVRTLIAEYVMYLMQVVRSRLEGEVSRIISEITGGRYEQVLLDEDFNLLVRDIDDDFPIDRFSGGEQDDIAVALRIALSRYLAELHRVHESTFLIFDEIFGSQDEERRNNLLTALRTQESRFPQILLISHIAEIQGEFANTLVVEMGSDNASRVKEVE
jgi:exonuclease SbcC